MDKFLGRGAGKIIETGAYGLKMFTKVLSGGVSYLIERAGILGDKTNKDFVNLRICVCFSII